MFVAMPADECLSNLACIAMYFFFLRVMDHQCGPQTKCPPRFAEVLANKFSILIGTSGRISKKIAPDMSRFYQNTKYMTWTVDSVVIRRYVPKKKRKILEYPCFNFKSCTSSYSTSSSIYLTYSVIWDFIYFVTNFFLIPYLLHIWLTRLSTQLSTPKT